MPKGTSCLRLPKSLHTGPKQGYAMEESMAGRDFIRFLDQNVKMSMTCDVTLISEGLW